jgi:hypothetical protein
MSSEFERLSVDRYRDIYHPIEGWDGQIKRAEAAHLNTTL